MPFTFPAFSRVFFALLRERRPWTRIYDDALPPCTAARVGPRSIPRGTTSPYLGAPSSSGWGSAQFAPGCHCWGTLPPFVVVRPLSAPRCRRRPLSPGPGERAEPPELDDRPRAEPPSADLPGARATALTSLRGVLPDMVCSSSVTARVLDASNGVLDFPSAPRGSGRRVWSQVKKPGAWLVDASGLVIRFYRAAVSFVEERRYSGHAPPF